jgi:hypothetical protein
VDRAAVDGDLLVEHGLPGWRDGAATQLPELVGLLEAVLPGLFQTMLRLPGRLLLEAAAACLLPLLPERLRHLRLETAPARVLPVLSQRLRHLRLEAVSVLPIELPALVLVRCDAETN